MTTLMDNKFAQIETVIAELKQQRHIPCATYRLQFSAAFTFRDALALVPYLHDLGISDVYASPILRAVPGSPHGYDVCDHSQLNPELGTMEDFKAFSTALHERGMGLIVDIVPNHMGIGGNCNPWWTDVLENGTMSPYASYFDIDWSPVKPELENRVLLPILEDQYGVVLDAGKLILAYENGSFVVRYADHVLPIAPRTYRAILEYALHTLTSILDEGDEALLEYQSILTALNYLPPRLEDDPDRRAERQREKEVIKRRLAALYDSNDSIRAAIEEAVRTFNGTPDDPASFDRLDALLDAQPYRLAYWRVAAEEINFRRFFDINTMAAIRVELPEVFHAVHDLTLRLMAEGHIDGLRIDHPDGLWNPARYFRQLQASALAYRLGDPSLADQIERYLAEENTSDHPVYVVAEKILTENEPLPRDWAVMGTTGYDFAAQVNGLFVDASNEAAFSEIYGDFTVNRRRFSELEHQMKLKIMRESLAGEINALAHDLERLSQRNRRYRDFTLNGLRTALREVIASLPIYRTYVDGEHPISERDAIFIAKAVRDARRRNPGVSKTVFDFIRDTLLLANLESFREEDRPRVIDFVMHFQQMTGPVMAKSVEDTSFYVYNRLVSLNEVGGNPSQFGISLDSFHEQNMARQRDWQHSMLTLSTHDTKRSEDVRARLNVLSEMPEEWRSALARWSERNANKKQIIEDEPAPSTNDEYLLYQTLLGAWSFRDDEPEQSEWSEFRERIKGYMAKATREAKVHTSWTNPDEDYDRALSEFVDLVLDDRAFIDDFLPLQRRVAFFGRLNSLSQTMLKLTCPGVPDTYRGTELWDFSLVDPDNRRPVDYDHCRTLLAELKQAVETRDCDRAAFAEELLAHAEDGRIKLYITYLLLNFRRDHEKLFQDGAYTPLNAEGERAPHVCAFERRLNDQAVIIVTPRLFVGLTDGVERVPVGQDIWGDTSLSIMPGNYRNLLTDEFHRVEGNKINLAAVFGRVPLAVLIRE